MTTIPAKPGFVLVIPLFDIGGVTGFSEHGETAAKGCRSSMTLRSRKR
jgi:hypothetical protein